MDKTFNNDAFTFVGIKSNDPEIVGTNTMDFSMEVPVGEIPVKVGLKLTSTVASSVLAQEKLNQIARDNTDFLGSKIAGGITYLMDNSYQWLSRVHQLKDLQKQWRQEEEQDA